MNIFGISRSRDLSRRLDFVETKLNSLATTDKHSDLVEYMLSIFPEYNVPFIRNKKQQLSFLTTRLLYKLRNESITSDSYRTMLSMDDSLYDTHILELISELGLMDHAVKRDIRYILQQIRYDKSGERTVDAFGEILSKFGIHDEGRVLLIVTFFKRYISSIDIELNAVVDVVNRISTAETSRAGISYSDLAKRFHDIERNTAGARKNFVMTPEYESALAERSNEFEKLVVDVVNRISTVETSRAGISYSDLAKRFHDIERNTAGARKNFVMTPEYESALAERSNEFEKLATRHKGIANEIANEKFSGTLDNYYKGAVTVSNSNLETFCAFSEEERFLFATKDINQKMHNLLHFLYMAYSNKCKAYSRNTFHYALSALDEYKHTTYSFITCYERSVGELKYMPNDYAHTLAKNIESFKILYDEKLKTCIDAFEHMDKESTSIVEMKDVRYHAGDSVKLNVTAIDCVKSLEGAVSLSRGLYKKLNDQTVNGIVRRESYGKPTTDMYDKFTREDNCVAEVQLMWYGSNRKKHFDLYRIIYDIDNRSLTYVLQGNAESIITKSLLGRSKNHYYKCDCKNEYQALNRLDDGYMSTMTVWNVPFKISGNDSTPQCAGSVLLGLDMTTRTNVPNAGCWYDEISEIGLYQTEFLGNAEVNYGCQRTDNNVASLRMSNALYYAIAGCHLSRRGTISESIPVNPPIHHIPSGWDVRSASEDNMPVSAIVKLSCLMKLRGILLS